MFVPVTVVAAACDPEHDVRNRSDAMPIVSRRVREAVRCCVVGRGCRFMSTP